MIATSAVSAKSASLYYHCRLQSAWLDDEEMVPVHSLVCCVSLVEGGPVEGVRAGKI